MTTETPSATRRPSGLEDRRVADAMSRRLVACDPDTPLRAVAAMMAQARIHCVVVEDQRSRWGLVSDLDVVAAGASGATDRTAAQAAATEVLSVATDETLQRAAQLMAEHELTHLVTIDPQTKRPAGVLSTLDIAAALAAEPGAAAAARP